MKCIKKKTEEGTQFIRVSDNIAAVAVEKDGWSYTSKSKYKKIIKNNKPKFTAGIPNSKPYSEKSINSSKISKHTESHKKATGGKNYRKGRFETPIPSKMDLRRITIVERMKYYNSAAFIRHEKLKQIQEELTKKSIEEGVINTRATYKAQAKKRQDKIIYLKKHKAEQNATNSNI